MCRRLVLVWQGVSARCRRPDQPTLGKYSFYPVNVKNIASFEVD